MNSTWRSIRKDAAFAMKCQRCGADIPEGKFYCEKCGCAIQIVPDYNPMDDITIGAEEQPGPRNLTTDGEETVSKAFPHRRLKYAAVIVGLLFLGILTYQLSYWYILPHEGQEEELEEPILLSMPQFSVTPGTYDYSPLLTISHEERNDGIIYYTTDGSTPDEQSKIYNHPIELGEGTTVIRAVFIRSDGVQSEEVSGTYEVVYDYPDEPVFSVESGAYEAGFYVTLSAEDGSKIYYTTNGEEPGYESALYRGPIYISKGLTVLQAVSVDQEGGMSGIVEAIYKVTGSESVQEEDTASFVEETTVNP